MDVAYNETARSQLEHAALLVLLLEHTPLLILLLEHTPLLVLLLEHALLFVLLLEHVPLYWEMVRNASGLERGPCPRA